MDSTSGDRDTSTRTRILRATYEVLSRRGAGKLSLSDVAIQAKISRPTLYRLFSSKEQLLAAFGEYELHNVEKELRRAATGPTEADRLDAVLRSIVASQSTYRLTSLVHIEPDHVLSQMNRIVPIMRDLLGPLVPHGDPAVIAGTIVRLAVSHYLVAADDHGEFLAQLRHVAGISGTD
ncbi:TetR/AcrR family transcriptional regulator [Nocardia aurantia]|uniref:HTH tetR-type domain-containing protein n=1 Tax=Nocardia aurantia TaxID=2585199 RepID=A0A7K0DLS7_9NOCA|nr:helix-turn-helix domain-containing protein [Nocardia aurantia]MQY26723.1 hypothetical protein [Nocardia aurantia]